MIKAELARRTDATVTYRPLRFVVYDTPGALSDVDEALQAIEAEREAHGEGVSRRRVTIVPRIEDAVAEALAARHPKQFARPGPHILARVIVKPGRHDRPQEQWPAGRGTAIERSAVAADPERAAAPAGDPEGPNAIERARARIEALRDRR